MTLVIDNWAAAVIVLVLAGIGLFLRHYLVEKAKNLATKEDIAELTRTTEQIKAQISHETWDRQTRWTLKRDVYFRLLESVGLLRTAMLQTNGLEILRRTRDLKGDPEYAKGLQEKRKAALEQMERVAEEFNRVCCVVPVVLSSQALQALADYRVASSKIPGLPMDALEQRAQLLEKALRELILAAKKDLGIE